MLKITPVGDKAELGSTAYYRGVKLLIARGNNKRYRSAFRRLTRPHQKEIDNNTIDEDTGDRVLCEALAEGVLINWDKTTFPGNIEYSVENATELLLNDPDCRTFVMDFANDINNYLDEDESKVAKE